MIILIPFHGFYESIFSASLDRVEEQECENKSENNPALEPHEYADLFYHYSNYGVGFDHVAKKYVEYFNDFIKEEYEVDLWLQFESMESPREYNFTTDKIYCRISDEKAQELFNLVSPPIMQQTVNEHLKSRSGFISFYSEFVEGWKEKPLLEWDHNELSMLLYALLYDAEDYAWKIDERMNEGGVYDTALDKQVNWTEFEAAVNDMIAEREAV